MPKIKVVQVDGDVVLDDKGRAWKWLSKTEEWQFIDLPDEPDDKPNEGV